MRGATMLYLCIFILGAIVGVAGTLWLLNGPDNYGED